MKTFFKELKIVIGFFALLTAVTIFTIVDFESDKNLSNSSLYEIAMSANVNRTPAAVNAERSLTLTKEFFCPSVNSKKRDSVNQRMVMLNFKTCQQLKNLQKLEIENQSNGFKAQVFTLESNSFKTDYIQLNEGLNKLKLQAVLKDGQKIVESLEILSVLNSKQ